MKPAVPKIEKPKTPVKPIEPPAEARIAFRPQGRQSLVSAGQITSRATTRKASLLG